MIISKRTIFSVILLAAAGGACAQNLTREEYIERYKHIAIRHRDHYGIPASITLAQGILESGSGNSTLARNANNHFGIKCHTDWQGERYYHDDDRPQECFRVYDNPEESFEDHAEFLSNHRQRRYDSLFLYASDDYRNWARGLKAAGYATAPDYAERLIKIIEDNKLYIFDTDDDEAVCEARPDETTIADNIVDVEHNRGFSGEGGVDPDNYRVTVNAYHGYNVYRSNGVSYVLAKAGDTYEDLSLLFRVAPGRLRRFNEVADNAVLKEGDIVYIERKRKYWEGAVLLHTVSADTETLSDIAQNYGVRLKTLARLNKVKPDAKFTKGRTVKLR